MQNVLMLSTTMNSAEFLKFLNGKRDFCAAFIDPGSPRDFQSAKVYLERRKNNIFIIINRGSFTLDMQYVAWMGEHTELVHFLGEYPRHNAYMTLIRFVKQSGNAKEHALLQTALDEIHYYRDDLVKGGPEYNIEKVPLSREDTPKKAMADKLSGKKSLQMKLF